MKIENNILTLNGTTEANFYLKITNGFAVRTSPVPDGSPWLSERLGLISGHKYALYITKLGGTIAYNGTSSSATCGLYLYTKDKTYDTLIFSRTQGEVFAGVGDSLYVDSDSLGEDFAFLLGIFTNSWTFDNYKIKINIIDVSNPAYIIRDITETDMDMFKYISDSYDKNMNRLENLSSVDIKFERKNNTFYQFYNNTFYNNNDNYKSAKVYIDQNIDTYIISTKMLGTPRNRYSFVSYFDEDDTFISSEYNIIDYTVDTSTPAVIENAQLHIPENASWFFVNGYLDFPVVKGIVNNPKKYIGRKSFNILFIGNSLTQDAISYLPYMLYHYYPEIDFNIYMWYCGGHDLSEQYEKFINNSLPNIFSVAENQPSWNNGRMTMKNILSTYTFDIVCMQDYWNQKTIDTVSDIVDWNNCQNYITDNYIGGNSLEFITFFAAPQRSIAESVYELTKTGIGMILQDTIADDVLVPGIAVYDALSTELDNLGDNGHLGYDDYHTQEGLPCLLQTYTVLCWLFNKLAIPKSIYDNPFRMTTEIYNTIDVPGPNLGSGVITGTDEQNMLAQKVAIQAYKKGISFLNNNLPEA